MKIQSRQVSSLEKVRGNDFLDLAEVHSASLLAGERFSYQLCITSDEFALATVSIQSPFAAQTKLSVVKDANMDAPVTAPDLQEEDYITLEPGLMPDILVPLEESNYRFSLQSHVTTLWIRIDVPKDAVPGTYKQEIQIQLADPFGNPIGCETFSLTLEVLPAVLPEQKLIYTRWFYADCIAQAHQVPIFSEAHWELMDKYIAAAADMGINMILVPIHTPPLDTAIGSRRPCVQLVDIEKEGDTYHFSFDKFHRFIQMCKKHNIRYFEMAHMFSQWGAKCAPNIQVTENGCTDYLFGWHVAANSVEYTAFLKQYIAAISAQLEKEGISENTYFHISDEPSLDNLETYERASQIIRPLIGKSKTFDALSNYVFYENGLVESPVTSIAHIHEFLEHDLPNQWVYYCCEPQKTFPNSFLADPSYRVRILGFLLYKYDIKGFLHWGFNFYNTRVSLHTINPYFTTSGDNSYPSGDPFIVYPALNDVYSSIRGEVLYEAIQDMTLCFALEEKIGREKVVQLIDEAAGFDLRFDHYPKGNEFFEKLHEMMKKQF